MVKAKVEMNYEIFRKIINFKLINSNIQAYKREHLYHCLNITDSLK